MGRRIIDDVNISLMKRAEQYNKKRVPEMYESCEIDKLNEAVGVLLKFVKL